MSVNTPSATTTRRIIALFSPSCVRAQSVRIVCWLKRPLVQRVLLLLAIAAILLSLGNWLLQSSHPTFAKTTSFETCLTALPQHKPSLCNGADPIQGGCSFDAQTFAQTPVVFGNQTVGLAQVRFSVACGTFWGRGFSYLPGKSVSVYVAALGTGGNASFLSTTPEAYSNMVYGTPSPVTVSVILSATQVASATVSGIIPGV